MLIERPSQTSIVFRENRCLQTTNAQNLTYICLLWHWKLGQGHQNLIKSSSCPNVISMLIWFQLAHYSTIGNSKYLPVYNSSISQWRSRLEAFQRGIVHEIFCTQESVMQTLMSTQTGSTSKTIWALPRENLSSGVCEQHRRRPACASAQSDQRLC